MPKRTRLPKVPDYFGIGNNPYELTVQKTHPLMTLSETGMTLAELKILDVYLSRINSHEPEYRNVRIGKGELERILEVVRIPQEELEKRLDNLFKTITIRDKNKRNGFTKIALFEKAEAFVDENGQWQVDLTCTPSAMEYIFTPEAIGYLKYRLSNVVNLTSRYSYVLYLYLESNQFRRSWKVGVQELKDMLHCDAETYKLYKRFSEMILKQCRKELHEKTTLRFEYAPVRSGKKVTHVQFTVLNSSLFDSPEEREENFKEMSMLAEGQAEQQPLDFENEYFEFLAGACDNKFTEREMEVIFYILANHNVGDGEEDVQLARFCYLARMYGNLKHQEERNAAAGKPIQDRFRYFKRMLENDTTY